ncbi:MAG: hypothetical protein GY939_07345 [Actinomycetia bacterium]|nr:hypothetical protein [Actinomycetes bacterium]
MRRVQPNPIRWQIKLIRHIEHYPQSRAAGEPRVVGLCPYGALRTVDADV